MRISRQVTNVINGVGGEAVVKVNQWIGLVEDVGAPGIARLDGIMPGQTETHTPEETPRLAFDLAASARVHRTMEARGTKFGENVKAHGNILGASPRTGEERNHKQKTCCRD
jgi:hypothetical protein